MLHRSTFQSFLSSWVTEHAPSVPKISVEAAEGRTAHDNGWTGVNRLACNTWKPHVWCVDTIPLTPFQPFLWAVLPSAASTDRYTKKRNIPTSRYSHLHHLIQCIHNFLLLLMFLNDGWQSQGALQILIELECKSITFCKTKGKKLNKTCFWLNLPSLKPITQFHYFDPICSYIMQTACEDRTPPLNTPCNSTEVKSHIPKYFSAAMNTKNLTLLKHISLIGQSLCAGTDLLLTGILSGFLSNDLSSSTFFIASTTTPSALLWPWPPQPQKGSLSSQHHNNCKPQHCLPVAMYGNCVLRETHLRKYEYWQLETV